ncbi:MAG: hypothetical protein K2M23_01695 [Alphaproteobacteria bacterium]|nr:hypothetical protein [Alphaproteobacteria bacterium]
MKVIAIILLIIMTGFLVGLKIRANETDLLLKEFELREEQYWQNRMEAIASINWDNTPPIYE